MQAHRHFYAQNLFLRETFAQNNFAQKTFDTEKFVHTDCAQIFLQTDFSARRKFTQSNFCTAEPFSHRNIYAQKKLRTAVFTCRRFLHETPPQLESQDQQRNCHFHSATGKSMSTICSRACPRGNGLWTCAPLVCPSFPCSPPCLCAQPAHRQPHSHQQVGGAPHQRHHHPHPSSPHTLPAGIHPTC